MLRTVFGIIAVLLLLMLLGGCNNAFRSNYTSIQLSKPVAEYLSQQTLTIHNNQPRPKTRKVKVFQSLGDSIYRAQYRKLMGTTLILEVSDSLGKIRNIAIPQTKLKAYPLALTTTATPLIVGGLLSQRDPYYDPYYIDITAIGIAAAGFATDAMYTPIAMLLSRNNQYAVPTNFTLNNLEEVALLDTSQHNQLYQITVPVNPNITPFLDADFQRKYKVSMGVAIGYGLIHRSTSNVGSPKLPASSWFSMEANVQSQPHFQWGLHHTSTQPSTFNSSITSFQIGYVDNQIKNGELTCGIGLGLGTFKRIKTNNILSTSTFFRDRTLGEDSQVLKTMTFIPGQIYFFAPVSGYIQYNHHIKDQLDFWLGFRFSQIKSSTPYNVTESLLTKEQIAPGIYAERQQNIGSQFRETLHDKNMVFQFNLGLKYKLNQ